MKKAVYKEHPDEIDFIMEQVRDELASAQEQYPRSNSNHEAWAIILEEVEELWDEIKACKDREPTKQMLKEAIQIMAMCLRFITRQ